MVELEKVLTIRVNSLNDLIRLAASVGLPQSTIYLLKFREKRAVILGILVLFKDYYKFYGVPVFYYYPVLGEETSKIWDSNYIILSSQDEKVEFSRTPKPGMSIPMVALAEKPVFIPELEV